ncbi:unnamed protein product [Rotaria sp. Silwood1]|nr:unnamed protein product [Rotaria sp. Silwood1]
MGNLTAVPTLRRTPKVSNSNARQSTVSSVTNGRSLPLPRHETYVVHHNLSSSLDSSLWIAIKNRRKYTPKTNRIKTTRYNIITFLPKNLFEQFHRVANVYFAILIGLNWVPIINAISRNVAFIPLTVILTITAIKDLVEDLKRWRSDAQTNKQIAEVYNKSQRNTIGDGANDVGMIRESHCGVAVYGREGSQAVAAGDFAVDRFECLRRLLLVHGAWCFTRTSELILYTFMHNCSYVFVIFYHQLFNGFSGAATLHSLYILLYSSLFTVLPQCAAALFDQHVPAKRALHEPQLYKYTLHARCYRMWSYWINIIDAIWQSTVIFFIAYYAYANNGNIDASVFGFSIAFSMTITSMIHVILQTTRIDIALISSILLSFLVFLGFTLIFDATCVVCLNGQSPYYISYVAFRQGIFWLTNLFTIIIALLPRFFIKCIYNSTMNPLSRTNQQHNISSLTQDTHV